MKAVKVILIAMVALLALASCEFPDYGLSFEVISADDFANTGTVKVQVRVENVGEKDLKNVFIEATAINDAGTAGSNLSSSFDLSSGGIHIVFVETYPGGTFTETISGAVKNAFVSKALWDVDE